MPFTAVTLISMFPHKSVRLKKCPRSTSNLVRKRTSPHAPRSGAARGNKPIAVKKKPPAKSKTIPLRVKCRQSTGAGGAVQRKGGSVGKGVKVLPEKLNAGEFESALAQQLEPFLDLVADDLAYAEIYKEVKKLNCWPRLLRKTCLAFYRANHKVIPKTQREYLIAGAEHFIAEVKREGRDWPAPEL